MGPVAFLSLLLIPSVADAGRKPASFASEAALSQDAVVALARDGQVRSVDELLPLLPEEYRRGRALIHASRSLQAASRENPRVVLFGRTGKLLIAFNGAPTQRGYDDLEMLEIGDDGAFRLREIQFSRDGSSEPKISAVNPGKCVSCHGEPARPVLDNFPEWPGFFGLRHEVRGGSLDDKALRALSARVREGSGGRYRHLPEIGVVARKGSLEPVAVEQLPAGETYVMRAPGAGEGLSDPDRLHAILIRQNYRRIFTELRAHPAYPKIRYALLAALERCSIPVPEYFPSTVRDRMRESGLSLELVESGTADAVMSYLDSRRARVEALEPGERSLFARDGQWRNEASALVSARYALLTEGLDADGWSMTREPSTFTLGDGQGKVELLIELLLADVREKDCEKLRVLSLASSLTQIVN
jgi:hypothetical protein